MASPHREILSAGRASEPAGRTSEPAGRASEPAGRALKPAGRASEQARRASDVSSPTGAAAQKAHPVSNWTSFFSGPLLGVKGVGPENGVEGWLIILSSRRD